MLFAEICWLMLENSDHPQEQSMALAFLLCFVVNEGVRGFIIFNPTELLNDFYIVYFGMWDRSQQAKT